MEQALNESDDSILHDLTNMNDDTPSEASDSNSYTSDTPLIRDKIVQDCVDIPCDNMSKDINSDDHEIRSDRDILSNPKATYSTQISNDSGHLPTAGDSLIDINDFLDGSEEVQVHLHPLNIIGGGWECGSVSSLYHIAASKEGFHSRLGTIERGSNQGSVTFLPHNRLLSRVFANSLGSFQLSKKGSTVDGLNSSFIPDKLEPPQELLHNVDEAKPKNFKNLCVVSIGLTILYFAIGGLRNLQSSLNSEGGIGVISLAATFAAFTVSSLISPFIVQMYRPKLCLIVGFTSHIFYVMANYCPRLVYFIPASVILGFGNALTWNAACTYITELGINEADWKRKFPSHVLSRYFGFFFLTYQSSTVFGNLISSLILVPKSHTAIQSHDIVLNTSILETLQINDTYAPPSTASSTLSPVAVCGVGFSDINGNNSTPLSVDEFDKLFLLGTYATCVIVAILTIVICLDHLPNYISKSASAREILVQGKDVILMTMDRKFIFIVVLCLYTVVGNGFVVADTLRAYVTCPLGIYMVGYTMICFGVCGSISSFTFGRLQKHIGRVPIFLLATLINVVSLVVMVTWHPVSDDVYYIFVLLGAWGFADGIWQSQTISLISSVFCDQYETALGCCRFLQGIAGIVVFLLSDTLVMRLKITVVLGTCLMAFILYMIMEVSIKCRRQDPNCSTLKQTNEIEVGVKS